MGLRGGIKRIFTQEGKISYSLRKVERRINMKTTTDFQMEGFLKKVKELFANTPLKGKIYPENVIANNPGLSYESLYQSCEQLKEQIKHYLVDWNVGDVLVRADGKELMIIYSGESKKPYQILDLDSGKTIAYFVSNVQIKEDWNFSIFNLLGEFKPQIVSVKKYKI